MANQTLFASYLFVKLRNLFVQVVILNLHHIQMILNPLKVATGSLELQSIFLFELLNLEFEGGFDLLKILLYWWNFTFGNASQFLLDIFEQDV